MSTTNTFSSMDMDDIVNSFILFLSNQDEFKDFNFQGSAIKQLVRVLAYNDQQEAYEGNFRFNEGHLDSATLRKNIASLASSVLGYVPASKRAARASVQLVVTPSDLTSAPATLTLDRSVRFYATNDNQAISFSPDKEYMATLTNGVYTFPSVTLLQGIWNINAQLVQTQYALESYIIPDSDIDTDTLEVYVRDSTTSATQNEYKQFLTAYDLGSTAQIFFLKENRDGLYEVNFGDGKFANKLSFGNVITFRYLVTDGASCNNISGIQPASSIGSYFNIVLTPIDQYTYGGADNEDQESIRTLAPLSFASSGNAVTDSDYVAKTKLLFSEADQVIAWGGEKNNPPRPGYAFVAVKPKNSEVLSADQKTSLINLLQQYNVGSITPIIADPNYTYVNMNTTVKYDPKKSVITEQAFMSKVIDYCRTYSKQKLEVFNGELDTSRLVQFINSIDPAITGNKTSCSYEKHFVPTLGYSGSYHFSFNHSIQAGSVNITDFTVADADYQPGAIYNIVDDSNGVLVLKKTQGSNTYIMQANIGKVDYTAGTIDIVGFMPNSIVGDYAIIACNSGTFDQSITGVVDTILKINNMVVTMEIDNV